MPGRIVAAIVALLLSLGGGSAFAQESPVPPDGGGSSGSGGSGVAAGGLIQEGQRILTDGQEARVLVPGKTSTLELTFVNQGETPVRGAVARAFPLEGARLASTESVIGDVAPGASGIARFEVTIDAASCTEFFGLGGEIFADDTGDEAGDEADGFFKAGFPVACPGARLSIESVTIGGGDGDQAVEPGETVTLTVVLRNDGADPATGVAGSMTVRGEGVAAVAASARWPDIAPGASAASLTPFTILVAPDAKVQDDCPAPEPRPVPEPGTIEPGIATAEPVTVDPVGPGSSEPGGAGGDTPVASDQPLPAPMPMPPIEEPLEDPSVAFDALFEIVTGDEKRFGLEYSNRIVCAFEDGGVPVDLPAAARDAEATGRARDDRGGAVAPLLVSLAAIAAALGIRALVRVRA